MNQVRLFCSLVLATTMAGIALAQAPVIVDSTPPGPGGVTRSANRPRGVSSPLPPQLKSARNIFLSNAGAEAGLFPHPFSGTQDRAYGYMYRALQSKGHFTLVDTPEEADLVFEIHLAAPTSVIGGSKQRGTEDGLPTFQLTIFDRPTHYILWSLTQTVDKANLQKTHDKNFDDALGLLIDELTAITS